MSEDRAHRRRRFTGRDPDERHRVSTPLELLYDLTIVVAFGTAADELAHFVADGHVVAGVAARPRARTGGAHVHAHGRRRPARLDRPGRGEPADRHDVRAVRRAAADRADRAVHRRAARGGHALAPHHIAERYTVASLNALVHGEAGWTVDAALLMVAGLEVAFGCWWSYFVVPWAEVLVRHRERAFPFGYGHLLVVMLAPMVTVVGYETLGHRHTADALGRL